MSVITKAIDIDRGLYKESRESRPTEEELISALEKLNDLAKESNLMKEQNYIASLFSRWSLYYQENFGKKLPVTCDCFEGEYETDTYMELNARYNDSQKNFPRGIVSRVSKQGLEELSGVTFHATSYRRSKPLAYNLEFLVFEVNEFSSESQGLQQVCFPEVDLFSKPSDRYTILEKSKWLKSELKQNNMNENLDIRGVLDD